MDHIFCYNSYNTNGIVALIFCVVKGQFICRKKKKTVYQCQGKWIVSGSSLEICFLLVNLNFLYSWLSSIHQNSCHTNTVINKKYVFTRFSLILDLFYDVPCSLRTLLQQWCQTKIQNGKATIALFSKDKCLNTANSCDLGINLYVFEDCAKVAENLILNCFWKIFMPQANTAF